MVKYRSGHYNAYSNGKIESFSSPQKGKTKKPFHLLNLICFVSKTRKSRYPALPQTGLQQIEDAYVTLMPSEN